ncbi:carbohydrate kinase family protein [Corynebacterium tapiri]|uniref:Carbohydrate kinase n=1 Tax=Corynebacterium tapiri TaxID=1448266 RepID=A0A5C4U419_9CORY|nr:carbohydrate kinase [Corynebacterium tapiri]TNL97265.1 carbohydrate kinase [Corynebacterium tapiri]
MISVYGEGLVDLVPTDHSPLAPLQPALGGGPFNAAISAARLGSSVQFHSRLSTDHFGQQLANALTDEGVNLDYLERGPEPTTLAVTSIDDTGSATYSFYVEGTADRLHSPVLAEPRVAAFGTLSLALPPAADRYVEAAKELAAQGCIVALDPNIRPLSDTAEHRARLAGMLQHVSILKLSEEELEFFSDISLDVPVVVTTRGEDGLVIAVGGNRIEIPGVPTTVKDTIGAGDTIFGAICAQLDQAEATPGNLLEQGWERIGRYAVTAAAITCSRTGAQPPSADEVEGMLS